MTAFSRAGVAAAISIFTAFGISAAQDDPLNEPIDAPLAIADDDAATADDSAASADIFARDSLRIRNVVCPFKGTIDYKPGEIACYQIEVPENREKARSRMIELQFVKLAAREPEKWDAEKNGDWFKRADPIVYLTGGPGAKAEGYVKRLKDHGARDVRDLYILEQRGIGWSADFCTDYPLFDPSASDTGDWDVYSQAQLKAMEACFAKAKAARVDLSGYNTIENARDVHALRMALGFEEWNVWGISYGSILGQAYLKEDPEGIRAAVIDAIVPLRTDVTFHHIARHFDRDLTLLKEACDADKACAANFPDFKDRLVAAVDTVSKEPIEIDAIDTDLFPSGKAHIFQDFVGGIPFSMFYEQKNYGTMPALISALARTVEEKDYEKLRVITAAGGGGGGVQISQGMYDAIACNDNWAPEVKASFEQDLIDYPVLAKMLGDPSLADRQAEICKRYGANPRPAEDYLPVETAIRTVIAEGAMDPITPPPLAKTILDGFSNGTYVEFPYAGHGPTRSVKCAGEFLTKFYDNPDGELDTSCPESMEAPKFIGPLFETGGLLRLAALAAEDKKQVMAPGLWGGLSAFILILGVIVYSLAPIARLINGAGAMGTGGARIVAWLTSLSGAAAVAGIGIGAAMAAQANGLLLLFGLPGWTKFAAMAGLAAGPLGLILLWLAIRARRRAALPIGVLIGLILTGAAGIGLASWLAAFGFMPF
ncbi:MAG: alpha/beta fold hydrolase [Parvularculaceae bacterium]